jgi:hypothetical protein
MSARRVLAWAGLVVSVAVVVAALFVALPRLRSRASARATATTSPTPPAPPGRKIKARLFYVSDDGTALRAVERDVPFGEGTAGQAREILDAQIAPVSEPLVSPVPAGTTLRNVFVTERGDAYVDLGREVSAAHTGGTLDEILTVYAIVDALTANLPAIKSVQMLVDGKEVATLAGHVDLRRPLAQDLTWVQ